MKRVSCKLRVNDIVKIIAGKDKGKTGKILSISKAKDKVIVEQCNLAKKSLKPANPQEKGQGFIYKEMPLHISNVMYFDGKISSRLGKVENPDTDNKKRFVRLIKKTKEVIV